MPKGLDSQLLCVNLAASQVKWAGPWLVEVTVLLVMLLCLVSSAGSQCFLMQCSLHQFYLLKNHTLGISSVLLHLYMNAANLVRLL